MVAQTRVVGAEALRSGWTLAVFQRQSQQDFLLLVDWERQGRQG